VSKLLDEHQAALALKEIIIQDKISELAARDAKYV
jgi:hypothetical protein